MEIYFAGLEFVSVNYLRKLNKNNANHSLWFLWKTFHYLVVSLVKLLTKIWHFVQSITDNSTIVAMRLLLCLKQRTRVNCVPIEPKHTLSQR